MAKRLAIDWDDTELRLVAAQSSAGGITVTDAAVIPIEEGRVVETLREAVSARGLEKTDTFVAIGRGKAELRELKLPSVPDDELPDMVRFQAIRSFASAGESAAVDFLVTRRGEDGIEMIAAAIPQAKLDAVTESCEQSGLALRRLALRPLTAAALYLAKHPGEQGETVLIDLLASDAEIVIARDGKVIFVRTVRLPNASAARPAALAGELRRSLLACGSGDSDRRVLLWGRPAVHTADVEMLREATGGNVQTLNPFDLVDLAGGVEDALPQHVGRLAPLVGLLACDQSHADRLIDFLNPRKRIEKQTDHRKTVALVGAPVAVVALVGWLIYSQMSERTREIARLTAENAALKPTVEAAVTSIDRVEKVDQFLDGDVNWLSELRRIAAAIPPAEELILTSINASSGSRGLTGPAGSAGTPTIKIEGHVTAAAVIDRLEESLRDEHRRVVGDGAKSRDSRDAYGWSFGETVFIDSQFIRQTRYEALAATQDDEPSIEIAEAATADAEPESPPGPHPPDQPQGDAQPESDAPTQSEPEEGPAGEAESAGEGESEGRGESESEGGVEDEDADQAVDEDAPEAGEGEVLLETSRSAPRGEVAVADGEEVTR